MERKTTKTRITDTYWSMPEFIDHAIDSADDAKEYANRGTRSDFLGVESWAEAVKLGRMGWTEDPDETLALSESIVKSAENAHTIDTSFQPTWNLSGDEVDIGRYLAQDPDCMISFPLHQTSKVGRVVTLVMGTSISAAISTDTIIRRGRVIVALVMALDKLGHSVELWADSSEYCGRGHGGKSLSAYQRVLVKSAHDTIDPAAIMFALAHPAMHRCLVWGTWDSMPQPWREGLSLAAHRGIPRTDRYQQEIDLYPEGTIFFPHLHSNHDLPDADEFLRGYLDELGLLAAE
jgi:hypothetical protein